MIKTILVTLAIIVMFILVTGRVWAANHNRITVNYGDMVVLAIIGEAEGESYQGKLAVAYAILNRGTLKGVYGLHDPRVIGHKYSLKTYNEALRAYKWASSHMTEDITHGATHWEGTAFKTPYWAKDMKMTLTVGNQRFYRKKG